MLSLYWRPVRFVFSTWQWPDEPSQIELSVAFLCCVGSAFIALYLYVIPGPSTYTQPIPHIPTAQENARETLKLEAAQASKMEAQTSKAAGPLQFYPDPVPPTVTIPIPYREYLFAPPLGVPMPSTVPTVQKNDPLAVGTFRVGQTAIGGPLSGNYLATEKGDPITTETNRQINIFAVETGVCPNAECPASELEALAHQPCPAGYAHNGPDCIPLSSRKFTTIAQMISDGNAMLATASAEGSAVPKPKFSEWLKRTDTYLKHNLCPVLFCRIRNRPAKRPVH